MEMLVTPESVLARLGVPVVELAPSRMPTCPGRFRRVRSNGTWAFSIELRKGIAPDLRAWTLWHELTHLVDCSKVLADGGRVGCSYRLGYGRISGPIAMPLYQHKEFLIGLSEYSLTYKVSDGRVLSIEEVKADKSLSARDKSYFILRESGARTRHYRYKTQSIELLAEAAAGAICLPAEFDAGAPGLRATLQPALCPEGFPL